MPLINTGIEHTSAYLTCQIKSVPKEFQVRWFRNGDELLINTSSLKTFLEAPTNQLPDYQIETNETCSVLRIFNLHNSDHKARFRCLVNSTVFNADRQHNFESEKFTQLNVLCK